MSLESERSPIERMAISMSVHVSKALGFPVESVKYGNLIVRVWDPDFATPLVCLILPELVR